MKPFIPPKDDDIDYNPIVEQQIEDMLFAQQEEDLDLRDNYDDDDEVDDLKYINIG